MRASLFDNRARGYLLSGITGWAARQITRKMEALRGKVMGFTGTSVWQLLIILLTLFIILFPLIHVLASDRSHGGAKFGWFAAVFLFSWLAYIVFLIVTQPAKDAASFPNK